MTIDKLRELYDDYLHDMGVVEEQKRDLRAVLGNLILGNGNRDSCNIRFPEKVEKALAEFDFENEEAGEVLDFVLCKGAEYKDNISIGIMMTAMQRFMIPFTEHISCEKAAAILPWYDSVFEKRDMTPVMVKLRKSLQKKAKRA